MMKILLSHAPVAVVPVSPAQVSTAAADSVRNPGNKFKSLV